MGGKNKKRESEGEWGEGRGKNSWKLRSVLCGRERSFDFGGGSTEGPPLQAFEIRFGGCPSNKTTLQPMADKPLWERSRKGMARRIGAMHRAMGD